MKVELTHCSLAYVLGGHHHGHSHDDHDHDHVHNDEEDTLHDHDNQVQTPRKVILETVSSNFYANCAYRKLILTFEQLHFMYWEIY